MADRLIRVQVLSAAVALALCTGSAAQALVDPTRPPLDLMGSAGVSATGDAEGASPRPRLESILLSSARKGAIINGQYVALGGAYGKATLVGITPTNVTLRTDKKLDVLQLYPSMEKDSAAPGAEERSEKTASHP
ncbi:MAG: MSHA biogenesis protein MshK [Proteobacteria bacterium]|nr:MSHA biogenesis protein MshK [Pseudomonadota bacterium]